LEMRRRVVAIMDNSNLKGFKNNVIHAGNPVGDEEEGGGNHG
jgi:hypothetical protein